MVLNFLYTKLFWKSGKLADNNTISLTWCKKMKRISLLKMNKLLRQSASCRRRIAVGLIAQKQPEADSFLGKQIGRQKGQVTIELILILTLFVFIATFISNTIEDDLAEKIIGQPWGVISGMIESGTWEVKGGGDYHQLHPAIVPPSPNFNYRHLSVKGEDK